MARKPKRDIITGIEVGTSTVKVVMGEFMPGDVLAIVGTGQAPSLHVQKGEILDVDKVLAQIARAVDAAEAASGTVIDGPIFVAATGAHIRPVINVGRMPIQGSGRTVNEDDVAAAIAAARSFSCPLDQVPIHSSERSFQVDDGNWGPSALGRVGDWLAAEVLLILGQHRHLQTICSMIETLMGTKARDIAFSGMADCFAAFGEEDARQGQLIIDIGAGVTEYAVYHGNGCHYASQVTIGCDHVANDFAIGLRLPMARCKTLVRELGEMGCSAVMTPDGRDRMVELRTSAGSGRRIPAASIEQILELRFAELFQVIRRDLEVHNALERVGGGVRLCGGGALVPGVVELAHRVLAMPASIARPRLLSGKEDILNAPNYMTPIGLIRWGKFVLDIDATETPSSLGLQIWHDARRLGRVLRESFRL